MTESATRDRGAVTLGTEGPSPLAVSAYADARTLAAGPSVDLAGALPLAHDLGHRLGTPGGGRTRELWEVLASLGAADLTVARAAEPHLDALAILDEARRGGETGPPSAAEGGTFGVYAAEGPGVRLAASCHDGGWRLTGTKPWCSLAARVSHALVTAWIDDTDRGLFLVDLSVAGVEVEESGWISRGLSQVTSVPVRFADVPAVPIGGPGWYLRRSGFAWGGMGVAAVWYGGAVGVARRLGTQATRREPDQIGLAHLGHVDAALHRARTCLAEAAAQVDAGRADGAQGNLLALRVRQVVADTAEDVLAQVARGLGPGPLALEEEHARRVADLSVYVRQHHAERDAAALGRAVLDGGTPW
jgi:alkylation response protein AidB-like acyl-CoA dehydrogenase